MTKNTDSMAGGIIMLACLIALLTIPMAIGYYTLSPATHVTQHAEISGASLN